MFYRIRHNVSRWRFELACKTIYSTAPVRVQPAALIIVTMLAHADLSMYLIAIKSLYRRLNQGNVLVLDDGSLSDKDYAILRRHVPGIEIRALNSIETAPCPRGCCWERLVWIMELSKNSYVVQMDSDTVTRDAIDEVLDCYRANQSFTLGTTLGRGLVPLKEAQECVKGIASEHIQIVSERALRQLNGWGQKRYVRGGAAFAGFGRGAFCRADLEAFSVKMEKLIGGRWREWGSEQVASNFMIANARLACVLPYPKYTSFEAGRDIRGSAFLHFIGSNRFDKGVYIAEAQRAISEFRGSEK
jgi:hypothetical protein